MLGSAFVFFMKRDIPDRMQKTLLGFASGVMVDGSFVEVPRPRNSREENKKIKEDKGGELWNAEEGDTENEKKHTDKVTDIKTKT